MILGPTGSAFFFRLTLNVTTFPARLSASTAVEWGTPTTGVSLTCVITSFTHNRPSRYAVPPGIILVMNMDVSSSVCGLSVPPKTRVTTHVKYTTAADDVNEKQYGYLTRLVEIRRENRETYRLY